MTRNGTPTIEEILKFAAKAEQEYSDTHGIDLEGTPYCFFRGKGGWVIYTEGSLSCNRNIKEGALYYSNGSEVVPGDKDYFTKPVVFLGADSTEYQRPLVHELQHMTFLKHFSDGRDQGLFSRLFSRKRHLSEKVYRALSEGISELMSLDRFCELYDEANLRDTKKIRKRHKRKLTDSTARWITENSDEAGGSRSHHTVGYNFIAKISRRNENLDKLYERIKTNVPTEEEIANPERYLQRTEPLESAISSGKAK